MAADDGRFGGIERLYGSAGLERLSRAAVMIVGIGGVGSWVAEALARSGVGELVLVDLDDVCTTNINRQIHALDLTVGRPKVEAMAERIGAIAPACRVERVCDFFCDDTAEAVLARPVDVVVDAIDDVPNKVRLVADCVALGRDVVVCGGAGGRRDPTRIRRADLARTEGDGLLRSVRKQLRRRRDFPAPGDGDWGIDAVFSDERPRLPVVSGDCAVDRPAPLRLDCRTGYGTTSVVTGALGLAAAGVVVDRLTDDSAHDVPRFVSARSALDGHGEHS